jgi:hypothetical protein
MKNTTSSETWGWVVVQNDGDGPVWGIGQTRAAAIFDCENTDGHPEWDRVDAHLATPAILAQVRAGRTEPWRFNADRAVDVCEVRTSSSEVIS